MNFSAICKNFFCLLILFALMGCEKLKSSSKKILPNPPDPVEAFHLENITEDHAIVSLDGRCMKLTNAQGKELGWGKNQLGDPVWPPEGDMGYFEYRLSGLEPAFEAVVSYSETFTASTNGTKNRFSVKFYQKGQKKSRAAAYGAPNGAIRIHSGNIIELMGDNSKILAFFHISTAENEEEPLLEHYVSYELEGSGDSYVRLSLIGDEIVAKGMTNDYTVTKTLHPGKDSLGDTVCQKTYNRYGTEIN